jgi:hypothetical protein
VLQRPGCLTPLALVFVCGGLLLAVGLAADSPRSVRAGAICLAAAVVLAVAGWFLRRQGWWE